MRGALAAYRGAFARHGPSIVAYSTKACALIGVLTLLRAAHASVASVGELQAALSAGIPARRTWLHGNAKTDAELRDAVALGVGRIVVDGEREPERIASVRGRREQEVWLRVSPEVVADTHTHLRTSGDQKFGVPIAGGAAEAQARAIASRPGLRLVGLHAHAGSQIHDLATFERVAASLASVARRLLAEGVPIRELCVGGGVAAPQTRGEAVPDLAAYARAVANPIRALLPPDTSIAIEPGRSLVARAGIALYRVVERAERASGRVFVAVDGGMGDNIRPALYGARYEAALASRAGEPEAERATIAGAYCEAGDVLIDAIGLPRAEAGDVLAIPSVGAYALAMASNYNHRPRPAVVLVDQGRARLIRRRERIADLLRLERGAASAARGGRGSRAR